jgi:hypothetical protein
MCSLPPARVGKTHGDHARQASARNHGDNGRLVGRRRATRVGGQAGRSWLGGPGPGAGHPVRCPVPDLPRQHHRERGAGQRAERPACGGDVAAMGGQRLRPHLCQLHVGRRNAGRHPRAQADHVGRRGGLLCRISPGRARQQRRLVDRRPSGHGRRRRRQRAGHAVHHPPRLSGQGDSGRRARRVGCRVGTGTGPWSGDRGRVGRLLELAGHLLVQFGLRRGGVRAGRRGRPRDVGSSGPPDRRRRIPFRRRLPRLGLVRGHSGGGSWRCSSCAACPDLLSS